MKFLGKNIYKDLLKENPHITGIDSVIFDIVTKLQEAKEKTVLLQGYVQSGKTSTYLLTIAKLIDMGYTKFFIITKSSLSLAQQTENRVVSFFKNNENKIECLSVKDNFDNLTEYELSKVNIFILKKHPADFEKVNKMIDKFSKVREAKSLILDDESDYASVGYNKKDSIDEENEFKSICKKILDLRKSLPKANFLSVTATPFVQYLATNWMIRPYSVVLLPTHDQYFGGQQLFCSQNPINKAIRENYFEQEEFNRILNPKTPNTGNMFVKFPKLSEAFITFILAGLIRNIQEKNTNDLKHYSMLLHIDTHKTGHRRIEVMMKQLKVKLENGIANKDGKVINLINKCYNNLLDTQNENFDFPTLEILLQKMPIALKQQVKFEVINSDNPENVRIDSSGSIKNSVPFSIFIGGYAVERGVTFKNLISFVFGRNSKRPNMDTSIQQLRIYGARSKEDLAVTRVYATEQMINTWGEMIKLDEVLRENVDVMQEVLRETENNEFVKYLANVMPSPNGKFTFGNANKIPGGLIQLKAFSSVLPINFTTIDDEDKALEILESNLTSINNLKDKYGEEPIQDNSSKSTVINISVDEATKLIESSYEELKPLEKMVINSYEQSLFILKLFKKLGRDKVHLYVKYNRKRRAMREENVNNFKKKRFDNTPHSGQDMRNMKKVAIDYPMLIMIHHEGTVEGGFRGIPFIWPIVCLPKNIPYNLVTNK